MTNLSLISQNLIEMLRKSRKIEARIKDTGKDSKHANYGVLGQPTMDMSLLGYSPSPSLSRMQLVAQ
jgi:hypothetical protein